MRTFTKFYMAAAMLIVWAFTTMFVINIYTNEGQYYDTSQDGRPVLFERYVVLEKHIDNVGKQNSVMYTTYDSKTNNMYTIIVSKKSTDIEPIYDEDGAIMKWDESTVENKSKTKTK